MFDERLPDRLDRVLAHAPAVDWTPHTEAQALRPRAQRLRLGVRRPVHGRSVREHAVETVGQALVEHDGS